MNTSEDVTIKCSYYKICVYADTISCPDIVNGCLMVNRNKEEAENP